LLPTNSTRTDVTLAKVAPVNDESGKFIVLVVPIPPEKSPPCVKKVRPPEGKKFVPSERKTLAFAAAPVPVPDATTVRFA
jgi:hypothetical protein